MKIGILTQPLQSNYGGLLQAYALQTVLQRLGHDSIVLKRQNIDIYKISLSSFAHVFKFAVLRLVGSNVYRPRKESVDAVRQNTDLFIRQYINCSPNLCSTSELKAYAKKESFDAYVVGSDQVWRPRYSAFLTNYFLDFAENWSVKRIAYAASFGVDDWEFTPKQGKRCAALAKDFDAISVREYSGVKLCHDYLGVEATHVLDPTLLLSKDDYIKIVQDHNESKREGNLFCYVLDKSADVSSAIDYISEKTDLKSFFTMPNRKLNRDNEEHHLEECIYPRVTEWLRSFMDAEMVVTDSFHGCVFSIIFNKPFWVIGNKERGMARFDSLLSTFGLNNRMVSVDDISTIDVKAPIDWSKVEKTKKHLVDYSMSFLTNNLRS